MNAGARGGPGTEVGGFTDNTDDRPPDPANRVAFTLNLTQCLATKGVTLAPGPIAGVNFHAIATDGAAQRSEARSDVPFKVVS